VTGRTIDEIGTDLAQAYERLRLARADVAPLLLELVRAKVHQVIPDAAEITLFGQEYPTCWRYSAGHVVTMDGTALDWDDEVADAIEDGADLAEDGGLDETLLADLTEMYPPRASTADLVIDLVRLRATPVAD
jgi:hypothetical protein